MSFEGSFTYDPKKNPESTNGKHPVSGRLQASVRRENGTKPTRRWPGIEF